MSDAIASDKRNCVARGTRQGSQMRRITPPWLVNPKVRAQNAKRWRIVRKHLAPPGDKQSLRAAALATQAHTRKT